MHEPFLLRLDNGLVFASCKCARQARSYGLRREFTPHCPQQNGMVERVIGDWTGFTIPGASNRRWA